MTSQTLQKFDFSNSETLQPPATQALGWMVTFKNSNLLGSLAGSSGRENWTNQEPPEKLSPKDGVPLPGKRCGSTGLTSLSKATLAWQRILDG